MIPPCGTRFAKNGAERQLRPTNSSVGRRCRAAAVLWLLISATDVQNHGMTIPAELVERLKAAQRVSVLTGAGVSAESGVPTFRGATVVEINPQPTPLTAQAHFALAGAAGVVLPALVKAFNASRHA